MAKRDTVKTLIARAKTLALSSGNELDDVLKEAQTFGPSELEIRKASYKNDGVWYEVIAREGRQAIPILCFRSKWAAGEFKNLLTEFVLLASAEAEGFRPRHFAKLSTALQRSVQDRVRRTHVVARGKRRTRARSRRRKPLG